MDRLRSKARSIASGGRGAREGEGKAILFVDDEEALLRLVSTLLEGQGHLAAGYGDSSEALTAFHANPDGYALAVLDQSMPGLTGLELAKAIVAQRPDFPVVICSGDVSSMDKSEVRAAGIRSILQKPVPFRVLSAVISDILGSREDGETGAA